MFDLTARPLPHDTSESAAGGVRGNDKEMKRVVQIAVPLVLAAGTLVVTNVAGAENAACDHVRTVEKTTTLVLANQAGCTPAP